MHRFSRRDLFIRSGLATAGLLTGVQTSAWFQAGAQARAAVPSADWADLSAATRGRLLLPNSPDYPTARLGWNTLYDNVFPQAVLLAADARDVQQAVRFCSAHGLQPTARSGGHSFQGFSSSRGLVIDVSNLNSVRLSADHARARIGSGALLIDIYRKLFEQAKVAIPGGACPLVGIAGLAQGGGIGPFVRQYGLTSDQMIGAEVVTADGRIRRIDASHDADLFWAIRGGGGGSFGVVTSFEFATFPVDMLFNVYNLEYAWSGAEKVLQAFQAWPHDLPLSSHCVLELFTTTQGTNAVPGVNVSLWTRGSEAAAQTSIDAFVREVGVAPISQTVRHQSFFEAEYDEYCQGLTSAQCAPVTRPPGQLPRLGLATCSEISRSPWPKQANGVLLEALEIWQRNLLLQPPGVDSGMQAGKVVIEPISGAVHRIASADTAFPHRDGWLIYQFQSRVRPGAPAEVAAAAQEWVMQLSASLKPWRTGSEYSNYGNRHLKDWGTAYFGANLPRLEVIKTQRDPRNLFRFEQSVRPAR